MRHTRPDRAFLRIRYILRDLNVGKMRLMARPRKGQHAEPLRYVRAGLNDADLAVLDALAARWNVPRGTVAGLLLRRALHEVAEEGVELLRERDGL